MYEWIYNRFVPAKTRSGRVLESQTEKAFENLCKRWRIAATSLCTRCEQGLEHDNLAYSSLTLLIAWERLNYMCVVTVNEYSEMAYDRHLSHFETIVIHCEKYMAKRSLRMAIKKPQPQFASGLTWSSPLLFTALSCRYPTIRRRAIKALRDLNQTMGIISTAMGALLGEMIMNIEHTNCSQNAITQASDLQESHRIRIHSLACYRQESYTATFRLRYMKAPWDIVLGAPTIQLFASIRTDTAELLRTSASFTSMTPPGATALSSTSSRSDEDQDDISPGKGENEKDEERTLPRVILMQDSYAFQDEFHAGYQTMRPLSWEFLLPNETFL